MTVVFIEENRVELLAPAGNMESFYAAIRCGADAIYIGGKSYSARAFADNFSDEEIIAAIKYAHIMNVKVYVVVNTILNDEEFAEATKFLDMLYLNDADAIIACDIGLIDLINNRYKDFPIHASTQLNTHNSLQISALEKLNIKRVILAREISLNNITLIKEKTDLELEVFIHGALCLCYSGGCLMSSLIGKRSGNKGKCAQPCRQKYKLIDDDGSDISDYSFLLSQKDLMTIDDIPSIIKSGVTSLKIEGRMKSPEYVGFITYLYKKAINAYYNKQEFKLDNDTLKDLKQLFSREFTSGHIMEDNPFKMVNTFNSAHIGEKVGEIYKVGRDKTKIILSNDIYQNDKILILVEKNSVFI